MRRGKTQESATPSRGYDEAPELSSCCEFGGFGSEGWRRRTLPPGLPGSTIRAVGLNGRVRDGNGCDPHAKATNHHSGRSVHTGAGRRRTVGALAATYHLDTSHSASSSFYPCIPSDRSHTSDQMGRGPLSINGRPGRHRAGATGPCGTGWSWSERRFSRSRER